jgi:hypothetical protein
MTTAQHLDAALEHLRAIGHGHEADALTRAHIEFASAHIREAWIADDGQTASTPEATHQAVAQFYKLQRFMAAKAARVDEFEKLQSKLNAQAAEQRAAALADMQQTP